MSMSVLLVEDNYHKRQKIISFFSTAFRDTIVREAYSYTSGSKAAFESDYDLVILDISLPTYDKTGNEAGGRKRLFGGREIARKLLRRKEDVNLVFMTQYDAFSDGGYSLSLDELRDLLQQECGERCLGVIFYDSAASTWKDSLSAVMKRVNPEK